MPGAPRDPPKPSRQPFRGCLDGLRRCGERSRLALPANVEEEAMSKFWTWNGTWTGKGATEPRLDRRLIAVGPTPTSGSCTASWDLVVTEARAWRRP